MQKKKVTLSLDSKVYEEFQKYCDEHALMVSKSIEIFMQNMSGNKFGEHKVIEVLEDKQKKLNKKGVKNE